MTVKELQQQLDLEILAAEKEIEATVINDVYIGDMLSWVIGNAEAESVWITIQTNVNVVAVAVMVGINCIIIAENAHVDPDTLLKAEEEKIPVLRSELTAYQIAKRIDLGN